MPDALFVPFRASWIVHEDDHLICVDKPAGMPSQPARPGDDDDVPTRLRAFLAARDGVPPSEVFLGSHQMLEREASGLLVFTRRREANPPLASQLEGRAVLRRYLVGVTGYRGGAAEVRLEHRLAGRRGGKLEARPARGGGRRGEAGPLAVCHLRLLRRDGDRALLEARTRSGGAHQVRAQLAAAGSPVVGDGLYGGVQAPRVLLHAAELRLSHPATGAPLALSSPAPPEMLAWLGGEEEARRGEATFAAQALERAAHRRYHLVRGGQTNAFRLLQGRDDGFSGADVDVYGAEAVLSVYDEALPEAALLDALEAAGFRAVFLKRRPRKASDLSPGERAALAPSEPARGRGAADELLVREHGIDYPVRLGDGFSTGLFLDQRDNRARVRRWSEGADVLNLFAYTSSFGLAAAVGGARTVVNVDASRAALDRGRRALSRAGFVDEARYRFVAADALRWLSTEAVRETRYDLVVVDPPTFSSTRSSRWTSGRGFVELFQHVLGVLRQGGRALVCSNDQRLGSQQLRRHLREGARAAGRAIRAMRDHPPPRDFASRWGEPQLKTVVVEL